jgi:hypothetical protein
MHATPREVEQKCKHELSKRRNWHARVMHDTARKAARVGVALTITRRQANLPHLVLTLVPFVTHHAGITVLRHLITSTNQEHKATQLYLSPGMREIMDAKIVPLPPGKKTTLVVISRHSAGRPT